VARGRADGVIGVCICDECRFKEMCYIRMAIENALLADPRASVVVSVVECSKAESLEEAMRRIRGVRDDGTHHAARTA